MTTLNEYLAILDKEEQELVKLATEVKAREAELHMLYKRANSLRQFIQEIKVNDNLD